MVQGPKRQQRRQQAGLKMGKGSIGARQEGEGAGVLRQHVASSGSHVDGLVRLGF